MLTRKVGVIACQCLIARLQKQKREHWTRQQGLGLGLRQRALPAGSVAQ